MLLHIPLILAADVFGAKYTAIPQEDPEDLAFLDSFTQGLVNAKSMLDSPLHQMPEWLAKVQTMEIPTVECSMAAEMNAEMKANLQFMRDAPISLDPKFGKLSNLIRDHMQLMSKRIIATWKWAVAQQKPWLMNLQNLCSELVRNANEFPMLLKDVVGNNPELEGHRMAAFVGLIESAQDIERDITMKASLGSQWLASMNALYNPIFFESQMDETSRFLLSLPMAKLLMISGEVVPQTREVSQLIDLLISARTTAFLSVSGAQKRLIQLAEMIPTGYRRLVGIRNLGNYAVLLDLVKREDGQVYGVKFGGKAFSLECSMAFICEDLSHLIDFIYNQYGRFNDLNQCYGVQTKAIKLSWFPEEKVYSPYFLIQTYADSWQIADRIQVGALWSLLKDFQDLEEAARKSVLGKITLMVPSSALALAKKVMVLQSNRAVPDNFLSDLLKALQARGSSN